MRPCLEALCWAPGRRAARGAEAAHSCQQLDYLPGCWSGSKAGKGWQWRVRKTGRRLRCAKPSTLERPHAARSLRRLKITVFCCFAVLVDGMCGFTRDSGCREFSIDLRHAQRLATRASNRISQKDQRVVSLSLHRWPVAQARKRVVSACWESFWDGRMQVFARCFDRLGFLSPLQLPLLPRSVRACPQMLR